MESMVVARARADGKLWAVGLISAHRRLFRGRGVSKHYDLDWLPHGWRPLVEQLCSDLDAHLPAKVPRGFGVVQAKEKFGGLRFYVRGATGEMDQLIDRACEKSSRVCEFCGKSGKLLGGADCHDWVRVACPDHERSTADGLYLVASHGSAVRDPARIPRMLEKIRLEWEKHPDLRLGQLVIGAVSQFEQLDRSDLFNVEDDITEYALDARLGIPPHPPCERPGCPVHDPDFVKPDLNGSSA